VAAQESRSSVKLLGYVAVVKEGDNEFIFADNPNQDLVPQHVTIKPRTFMARGKSLKGRRKDRKKEVFYYP
jgi:hypothetical protein